MDAFLSTENLTKGILTSSLIMQLKWGIVGLQSGGNERDFVFSYEAGLVPRKKQSDSHGLFNNTTVYVTTEVITATG